MKRAIYFLCFSFIVFNQAFSQNYYSQASQDEFTYTILYDLLHKNDEGFYLEIGAGYPIENNNTYFFERNLNWKAAGPGWAPGPAADVLRAVVKRGFEQRLVRRSRCVGQDGQEHHPVGHARLRPSRR